MWLTLSSTYIKRCGIVGDIVGFNIRQSIQVHIRCSNQRLSLTFSTENAW